MSCSGQYIRQFDRRCTRFSTTQSNISLIILSNVKSVFTHEHDTLAANFGRVCSITRHTNTQQFIRWIKRSLPYQNVILILDDLADSTIQCILKKIDNYRSIKFILIVDSEQPCDKKWLSKSDGTIESFNNYEHVNSRLQLLTENMKNSFVDDDILITVNCKEKSFTNLKNQLGSFIWIRNIKEILLRTPHNSLKSKSQLLRECRKLCRHNPEQLSEIKRFEESYRSEDAIKWYTKPCFLFRIVNNVLRSENPYYLYIFRYYIFDLSESLRHARPTMIDQFRLYRGSKISRDEIEKLTIGSLVAVNGFFSASLNRGVAEMFIGLCPVSGRSPSRDRTDNIQFVIYEIEIDLLSSADLVVAHACTHSYLSDEEEMIFDLGTTFVITSICYDEKHFVWQIQMTYSAEVAQLNQEYSAHICKLLEQFNAEVLFGRILATTLSEYSHGLVLFHELLRALPIDSEQRPKVYYELGRLYRFQGKQDKAIQYFQAAKLLQRRYLPQCKFDYGITLAGLSTVYLELGDAKSALAILEQSKICFRDYPFDYNYDTIFQVNLFSHAYYLDGQYERALQLLNAAITTYRIKMPSDHPNHAQVWHTTGLVQRALGHHQESLSAFKEALRMMMSRLSSDHPYIARTLYQMSLLYEEFNDTETAIDCIKKALSIQKLKLSRNHNDFKLSVILYERLISKKTLNEQ